jgi:hypothetical protein
LLKARGSLAARLLPRVSAASNVGILCAAYAKTTDTGKKLKVESDPEKGPAPTADPLPLGAPELATVLVRTRQTRRSAADQISSVLLTSVSNIHGLEA